MYVRLRNWMGRRGAEEIGFNNAALLGFLMPFLFHGKAGFGKCKKANFSLP